MIKVWEDFKAWRRGEKRVAPGMRGRVYARKENDSPAGEHKSKGEIVGKLKMKITRADGTVEFEEANLKGVKHD